MATRTSYLKLIKPGYDDAADVADLNANMDIIDSTIKTMDEDGQKSHSDFQGCSDISPGVRGFVPAPAKGDGKKFLSATGGWERAGHSPLELYDLIYPVGIVVEFENSTDPNTVFPGTTWIVTQKGQVAVGAGDYWENGTKYTYTLGDTGGEVKHLLTTNELAAHGHGASSSSAGNHNHSVYTKIGYNSSQSGWSRHSGSEYSYGNTTTGSAGLHSHTITISSTGGNIPHENRQPFKVVNKWLRTA